MTTDPKWKTRCAGGMCVCNRTRSGRVPVAFRNKCERVTGPQPERVRSIFAGVNATRTSGTWPERVTGTGPEREPEQVWTLPYTIEFTIHVKAIQSELGGKIIENWDHFMWKQCNWNHFMWKQCNWNHFMWKQSNWNHFTWKQCTAVIGITLVGTWKQN